MLDEIDSRPSWERPPAEKKSEDPKLLSRLSHDVVVILERGFEIAFAFLAILNSNMRHNLRFYDVMFFVSKKYMTS